MESISSMILFISALIVAGVVGSVFISVSHSGANSLSVADDRLSDTMMNDIDIVSDMKGEYIYDSGSNQFKLFIKNTGDKRLKYEDMVLIINGDHTTIDTFEIVSYSGDDWVSGEVLKITAQKDITNSDVSIAIEVEGAKDTERVFIENV